MFEYDKYFRECQQLNKPFIKAKKNPHNGNYFVQIDLMTCDYELSKPVQKKITQLIQNEFNFSNSSTKSIFQDFNIDKELAWFDGVSSERLPLFCETLYDITQNQLKSESN